MNARALILVLVLCLSFILPVPAFSAKETWTSIRSRNFLLIGNASERDIRRVATELEQFRDVFSRLFAKARFDAPVPTTVIVFKSDGAYKPFKPLYNGKPSEVAGYFQPGPDVNYITLTAERRGENPFGTIFHEFVHLLVENHLSNAPAWFNEGLAEYYSTFDVSGDDKKVTLGNPIANHVLLLREKFMPLETLFAVDHNSPAYNERDKRGIFYAESWAFVHYLIVGNRGQRLDQLGRFNTLLAEGKAVEAAFREAFQTDFQTMEKELKQYVGRSSYPIQVVTFDKKLQFENEMQSALITEAEAQSYLGDLLLHINRLDMAETHLQQAITLDPNLTMPHASLGMLRVRQNRFADAKQHLQRAVAAENSRNHLAHYYYALALSREKMNDSGMVMEYPPETAATMRAELRKAISLAPNFPESYRLLAFVNLVMNERLDESLGLMQRALAISPGRQEFALVLAQIYMRMQEFAKARQILEPVARNGADPGLRAQAQSVLGILASIEDQAARFKAEREAISKSASAIEEPTRGEASKEASSEAAASDVRPTLKRRTNGEQVRGLLTRIECANTSVLFYIKVGERTLKLQSSAFDLIEFITYTTDVGGELTCGARQPANDVIVTYRPAKPPNAKVDGEVVVVQFVPKDWK